MQGTSSTPLTLLHSHTHVQAVLSCKSYGFLTINVKVPHNNPVCSLCWQTAQVQKGVIYPSLYHNEQVCPLEQLLFLLSGFKPLGITSMWFWYDCICQKAKTNRLGQLLNSMFLKPLGVLFKPGVQNLTLMKTSFSSNTGWPQPTIQTSDLPCRFCSTPGHSSSTIQICIEGEDISCACSHL